MDFPENNNRPVCPVHGLTFIDEEGICRHSPLGYWNETGCARQHEELLKEHGKGS